MSGAPGVVGPDGHTIVTHKSALVRLGQSPDAGEWAERIQRGLVRITTVTRLEVGYSARTGGDARAAFRTAPLTLMPIPDALIASCAGLAGLTVLHLDKDFELIAGVTGQPVERLRL